MAWLFELESTCPDLNAAKAFGRHFIGFMLPLSDSRECLVSEDSISIRTDDHGSFRCCIIFDGAGCPGSSDEDRLQYARVLYEQLRTAPAYDFAVVGIECYDFDLFDRSGSITVIDGLVVSEQVF